MKNSKWLFVAGLVIMLMTIGCQDQMGSLVPNGDDVNSAGTLLGRRYNNAGNWFLFFYDTPTTTPETHLMSIGQDNGQNGSVIVWTDATNLYVEFSVVAPNLLYETHVDVAADSAGLRHNKAGNLEPGKFRFQGPNPITPPAAQNTITIPLSALPATTPWAMAALCKVFYVNENGDTVWNTGCGSDSVPENPDKTINLPGAEKTVEMRFAYWGGSFTNYDRSHWDVELRGIGGEDAGYNVWDGHWVGWCGRFNKKMDPALCGQWMEVKLYSCFDASLPAAYVPPASKADGWHKVSWLINEYSDGNWDGWYKEAYYFNEVVYYLLGQYKTIPAAWTDDAKAMAMAADEHGDYYPELPGSWFAVICHPVNTPALGFQPIFIEVDP
jgi:hypothetical protein